MNHDRMSRLSKKKYSHIYSINHQSVERFDVKSSLVTVKALAF